MLKLGTILLVSAFSVTAQTTSRALSHPCTPQDYRRSDDVASKPRSWDALYRVYKKYGRCVGVDTMELFSETVARILVDHWSTLPRLAKLSMDRGFRAFVLGHIDSTLDTKDVQNISNNAVDSCPSGLRQLCADIKKQADAAEAEYKSYHTPTR